MTVPAAPAVSDADTLDTLQAALDVFNGSCSTAFPAGGRQQLRDLVEKQKQAAAKAALLASNAAAPAANTGGAPPRGDRPTPPEAELRGVVFALEQSTIALCSYCHGFTADAGPSLARSLKQLCGAVVEPTKQLTSLLRGGDAADLRRAFGLVWGACDELSRGPLDNKACLFRELADVMQGIKAAAKELDELIEASRHELEGTAEAEASESPAAAPAAATAAAAASSTSTFGAQVGAEPAAAAAAAPESGSGSGFQLLESSLPAAPPTTPLEARADRNGADGGRGNGDGGGDEGGGGGDEKGNIAERGGGEEEVEKDEDDEEEEDAEEEGEEDSDDFRDMGTLSAGELCTAEAAEALLGAAQGALRAISRPLLEGPAVTGSNCLDDWESMAWHASKLRSSCEALVACLYPPHDDPEELEGETEAVANTLELMLAEFPEAYLGGTEGTGAGAGVAAEGTAAGAVAQQLEAAQRLVDVAAGRMREALGRMARGTAGPGTGPAGAGGGQH